MRKTALVTGISGQDGAYLAQLLLGHQYKVIGVIRDRNISDLSGLDYLGIRQDVEIIESDLGNYQAVQTLLKKHLPHEVYNLAAQSSVSVSFKQPIETFSFNTISVYNFLEAIRNLDLSIKFYQASSSEMFGDVGHLPITEDTEFHPKSPYAVSKAAAHWACVNYRESYGMFVCCGILFNHESYLRKSGFFMKKVLSTAIDIKRGKTDHLKVGNLDIKRDFGYAPAYIIAMYQMMQKNESGTYLISSGKSVSLRYIVEYIFEKLDLEKKLIVPTQELFRPAEIPDIYGNPEKVKRELGWNYDMSIEALIDKLLEEEVMNKK